MSPEELSDHTANIRNLLDHKKSQLKRLDSGSVTAIILRHQIDQLDPRVTELEHQCNKLLSDKLVEISLRKRPRAA